MKFRVETWKKHCNLNDGPVYTNNHMYGNDYYHFKGGLDIDEIDVGYTIVPYISKDGRLTYTEGEPVPLHIDLDNMYGWRSVNEHVHLKCPEHGYEVCCCDELEQVFDYDYKPPKVDIMEYDSFHEVYYEDETHAPNWTAPDSFYD